MAPRGWRLAVNIVVPMLAPATKSLLLLGVIGTLQTFPIVHLMTGGGPNHASEVFGTYIFKQSFVIGEHRRRRDALGDRAGPEHSSCRSCRSSSRRAARPGERRHMTALSLIASAPRFTIHAALFVVLDLWMIPQVYMLSMGLRTPAIAPSIRRCSPSRSPSTTSSR